MELKTIDFVGLFVVFCSVVSIFDERYYLSDLLSSFRFQYLNFLVAWLLYTLVIRKKIFIVSALIPIALNLFYLAPTWIVDKIDKADLKIYFANLLSSNDKYDLVINDILKKSPNLVVLQEVTQAWEKELSKLSKKYPYKVVVSREDNFGIAVYSSIEFKSYRTFISSAGLESLLVALKVSNENITM
ncbi:endonuclease/exonuclease/phosphatase family protein [Halobacteriovorax marinus]|uniref:endonuclease/exonuclease/phosphatase family protein n=1 Tax=Halobacteriovorax marinus TaxID=97084 RepID=UPI0012FEB501|nr:endonuclease/exonuclease/phosphatase family protein [Halobacteriovorax marinus]